MGKADEERGLTNESKCSKRCGVIRTKRKRCGVIRTKRTKYSLSNRRNSAVNM